MPEQNDAAAGDVIDAIAHLMSRRGARRIELKYSFAQMAGVKTINDDVRYKRAEGYHDGLHIQLLIPGQASSLTLLQLAEANKLHA